MFQNKHFTGSVKQNTSTILMPFSLHQCSPHTLILKCFIICCQNRQKTKGLSGNENIQLPISQLGIKAEESLKRKHQPIQTEADI